MRKRVGFLLILSVITGLTMGSSFAKKLDIYIPPVGVGLVIVDAVRDLRLKKYADKINVIRWDSPDQLRSGMMDGSINITFVPSYVGANFYNKGVKFRLVNIITGGILYIISNDRNIRKIEDLRGKTVVVPFQNDMPDLVLRAMIKKLKLSDVGIRYVATPTVAVKMALAGKANILLMPEVAATKIQMKSKKRKFYRNIDLTKEYGRIFDVEAYIPQAGVAVRETFALANPELVSDLHEAMRDSARKLLADPERVKAVTGRIWKNQGDVFAKSIKYWNLDIRLSSDVKDDIVKFYRIMYGLNPSIIGGKLPDSNFYMQP